MYQKKKKKKKKIDFTNGAPIFILGKSWRLNYEYNFWNIVICWKVKIFSVVEYRNIDFQAIWRHKKKKKKNYKFSKTRSVKGSNIRFDHGHQFGWQGKVKHAIQRFITISFFFFLTLPDGIFNDPRIFFPLFSRSFFSCHSLTVLITFTFFLPVLFFIFYFPLYLTFLLLYTVEYKKQFSVCNGYQRNISFLYKSAINYWAKKFYDWFVAQSFLISPLLI